MKSHDNPMGTDGFEFLEFCSTTPEKLHQQFLQLGFTPVARHRSKQVTLYRQGQSNFILNSEPNSQASEFARAHGAGVCAMGFKVADAHSAHARALSFGAVDFKSSIAAGEASIPAIRGIGDSVIYFVDTQQGQNIYERDFNFEVTDREPGGLLLTYIDHVTHNVQRGNMDKWATFYEKIFNFREIRYFDIQGQKTGLVSRAMTSPCNKIRIPINESTDDKSQIEEYLQDFKGEGIQHIALGSSNIYNSVPGLRKNGIEFLTVPDSYYEMIQDRVPWHSEDLPALHRDQILIDGTKTPEGGLLLQIFTQNMLGPVFFEIIQRKGNEGFGEGNFRALFEAIERDQISRGVL
jgi:4-hydroxyphenylpyruvate dioxygenase